MFDGYLNAQVFFLTIYLVTLKVYTEFEDSSSHGSQEICDKLLLNLEREVKGRELELVFVKHYAPNICLSPNMAEFAVL